MDSIYLAKSNRSNPDVVSAVRTILKKFGADIVEFTGGAYSNKPLLACDMLIVVPELSGDNDDDAEYLDVGKGLFGQIEAFRDKRNSGAGHFNECDLMIVNYYHEGTQELGIGTFDEFECAGEEDYVNYATIMFKDDTPTGTLSQILENRLGHPTENSTKGSSKRTRYRLLLTSK